MKTRLLFLSIAAVILLFGVPSYAANMRIVPSKTSVAPNETISATVYIDSPDDSINNAEGTITFPSDLITINSIRPLVRYSLYG